MVKSVLFVIFVLAYLIFLDAKLVGVLFAGLAVLCIISGGLRRVTSKLNEQYLAEKSKLNQISEEVFSNIRTVKAFHNDTDEIEKFRIINERVVLIGQRRAVWSGIFQVISYALMYGTFVAITYFGAKWNVKNLTSFLFLLLSLILNVVMLALNLGPLF